MYIYKVASLLKNNVKACPVSLIPLDVFVNKCITNDLFYAIHFLIVIFLIVFLKNDIIVLAVNYSLTRLITSITLKPNKSDRQTNKH